jgi:hypothetical protein
MGFRPWSRWTLVAGLLLSLGGIPGCGDSDIVDPQEAERAARREEHRVAQEKADKAEADRVAQEKKAAADAQAALDAKAAEEAKVADAARPSEKKPDAEKPVEKPVEKKLAPVAEKPVEKKLAPVAEKPVEKKLAPVAEKPVAKKPVAEKTAPVAEKPPAKKLAPVDKTAVPVDKPVEDGVVAEKPPEKKVAPVAEKKPDAVTEVAVEPVNPMALQKGNGRDVVEEPSVSRIIVPSKAQVPPDPACLPHAMEDRASKGTLSAAQIACLDGSYKVVTSLADRDAVSMTLINNAKAKGDNTMWEFFVRRHLNEVSDDNPALVSRFAFYLFEKEPRDAAGAYRWADRALDLRAAWTGAVYTEKVYGLHKLRAAAAQELWKAAEEANIADPSDDNAKLAMHYRLQMLDVSKEWMSFAKLSGKDASTAVKLCTMAADEKSCAST